MNVTYRTMLTCGLGHVGNYNFEYRNRKVMVAGRKAFLPLIEIALEYPRGISIIMGNYNFETPNRAQLIETALE